VEDGGSQGRSEDLLWNFQRRREGETSDRRRCKGEDKAVRALGLRVGVVCVRVLGSCSGREICGVRLFFFFSFLFSFGNSFLFFYINKSVTMYIC
jgi:hypothetical protein